MGDSTSGHCPAATANMTRSLAAVILLAVLVAFGSGRPSQAAELIIGYVELEKDPRYGKKLTYARYLLQSLGRPLAGAQVALGEIKFHGIKLGIEFALEPIRGKDTRELLAAMDELGARGARFFIIDAPGDVVAAIASATKGKDRILFNVSARDNGLRQEQCQAHLLHVIPSNAMLMDALAQYLVLRKWRRVLLLEGPLPEDQRLTRAFERAAKRYGTKIVDKRPFVLSNDPRQRQKNNVALLTGQAKYDVIFVSDSNGEFARNVPYQSVKPRLVVGSEGFGPAAWHWAWERHGAPQLEKRFEKKAKRPMKSVDWAAWLAVKTIAKAVQRTESADFATLRDYLRNPELVVDGFKGNRLNFRPWNNQLRQPILLTTHNWVVERAPLEGFLHQTNNMDTLGFDERENRCTF